MSQAQNTQHLRFRLRLFPFLPQLSKTFCFLVVFLSPFLSVASQFTMLSTLRVASRSAVARDANMRTVVIGARHASAWANVPQGPPVGVHSVLAPNEFNSSWKHKHKHGICNSMRTNADAQCA